MMPPHPLLDTPRLHLRPCTASDLDALYRLWNDPAVRRYLFDDEAVERAFVTRQIAASEADFAAHGYGLWVIEEQAAGALVGFGGYRPFFDPPELQLLIGLAPPCWGQGFATEAYHALLRYGFDGAGFDAITACADAPNAASIRLIERLGFRFRDRGLRDGLDTICYTLARADYAPPPRHTYP